MLGFLHPRSLTYLDPWTGQLFGEGGVEKSLLNSPGSLLLAPHIVHGTVIMPKLENATAK